MVLVMVAKESATNGHLVTLYHIAELILSTTVSALTQKGRNACELRRVN